MNNYYWIVGIIVIIFIFLLASMILQNSQPRACTEEAKLCPDGSAVGRVAPDCDFAPCPSEINCSLFSADNCPSLCVVCPPCEACSSISCQTEEFCKNIGFDRSWWESVNPKNNKTTDELCIASGGTVATRLCCQSSGDFPNTCLIGACGCSPDNSHDVKVCDCGEGKCWNGYECAAS